MFFNSQQSSLGIDIGTTSIKIIELQNGGKKFKLKNYGEYRLLSFRQKPLLIESSSFFIFEEDLPNIIKKILKEANIKERKAVFSFPIFSSFFTVVEFPMMGFEEISGAVNFQANQYIPIPLSEVVLDWQIIEEDSYNKEKIKVLLVAVPKDIIEKYKKLAENCNLKLEALEIESFSLARSLVKDEKDLFVIIDIGGRTSSITIIDKGIIRISHSLDFCGFNLTKAISKKLNISLERSEELKRKKGIKQAEGNLISSSLLPVIDKLIFSVERAIHTYSSFGTKREIKKIIFSGGGALLPGIEEYFSSKLQKKVEIGNPFANINYPPILNDIAKEMRPTFSTVAGLAMKIN